MAQLVGQGARCQFGQDRQGLPRWRPSGEASKEGRFLVVSLLWAGLGKEGGLLAGGVRRVYTKKVRIVC
jgi:hypothetical protein